MFFFFNFDDSVGIPSFDQMFKPVLAALLEYGGSASIPEIDEAAIQLMNLPDDVVSVMHKGSTNRTEVSYRLAWARTYLKKYGLIRNEKRGVWSLTEKFDGDIEKIDPGEITKKIRAEADCNDESENALKGFESVQAFENMIAALLKEITKVEGRLLQSPQSDGADLGYDFILPGGIEEHREPLICIVRYIGPQDQNRSDIWEKTVQRIKREFLDEAVLLILNITVSEQMKEQLGNRVLVWDREELQKRIDPEAPYAQYLINPKQALIEEQVTANTSAKDLKKEKEAYIRKIQTAFRNEDVVLFLGAGVSSSSKIPEWSTLTKKLHIQMISRLTRDEKLTAKEMKMLQDLAFDHQIESPLVQMRYIKSAFSDGEYYDLVRMVLYEQNPSTDTRLLNAIAKVCIPQRSYCGIKNVITYNFDDLLEKKCHEQGIRFHVISSEDQRQWVNYLNIYHVHGYLPKDPKETQEETNLVFSEEDYHKVYRDAYSWSNLTQLNAMRENTCVFIGCSLTDPNLRRLLDVAARNEESPRHFAFMKKKTVEDYRDITKEHQDILELYQKIDSNIQVGYYQKLGLNIIWVEDFDEIPDILEGLIE